MAPLTLAKNRAGMILYWIPFARLRITNRERPTGKRKNKKKAQAAAAAVAERSADPQPEIRPAPAVDPLVISSAELLRRLLLGAVTMLIVARPLVIGEDPGLLDKANSNPAGMILAFLWLLTAVGWAGWRLWTRERTWYG